jgi:hypothetical protein
MKTVKMRTTEQPLSGEYPENKSEKGRQTDHQSGRRRRFCRKTDAIEIVSGPEVPVAGAPGLNHQRTL